jgi:hypothetical protein
MREGVMFIGLVTMKDGGTYEMEFCMDAPLSAFAELPPEVLSVEILAVVL